jgi:hypothetical protein
MTNNYQTANWTGIKTSKANQPIVNHQTERADNLIDSHALSSWEVNISKTQVLNAQNPVTGEKAL